MIYINQEMVSVYICLCNSVTDSDIRHAADAGVRTMRQLKMQTGCGSHCGKCVTMAREVLTDVLVERRQFLNIVAVAPAA